MGTWLLLGVFTVAGPLQASASTPRSESGSSLPPEHVVGATRAALPASPPAPGLPAEDRARGMVFTGLSPATAEAPCAGLLRSSSPLGDLCTHGPDPAPAGIDVTVPRTAQELAAESGTTAAATAGLPCYGDGTSGKRVQAVYVRAADVADRYSSVAGLIPQWAVNTDKVFVDSAAETGGVRHVRWVTDAACNLVVQRVQLSVNGDDSFSAMASELKALGFNRTDRKYLLWVDANVYCGIAGIWGDDKPTADNLNNGGPSYARVDTGCWGLSAPVEAHELMHNLGGVQLSALHTTGGWHCTDEYDRMCYGDAAGVTMRYVCPSTHDRLFDCNHDDYFHTAPAAGSYLATHWDSAMSGFLESVHPGATPTTAAPPPSTTTTTTTASTTTTTTAPTTTTTIPPTSTTTTWSGSLNRRTSTRSYAITTGTGTLTGRLSFTKTSSLTLSVVAADGSVVARTSGPSPVSISAPVQGGSYTVVVSGSGNASFSLTVTYPTR